MYPCVSSSEPSPEKITTLSEFCRMYLDTRNIAAADRQAERQTGHMTRAAAIPRRFGSIRGEEECGRLLHMVEQLLLPPASSFLLWDLSRLADGKGDAPVAAATAEATLTD